MTETIGDGLVEISRSQTLDRMVQILEERNSKSGALFLGKDYFSAVYKYIMRFYRRYGGDATILLFELDCPGSDIQRISDTADQFSTIVEKALRMSDIMVQNGTQSFLVMLTQCGKENIDLVISRILAAFKETELGKDVPVNYVYKFSVAQK